jgi:hypothetical protein
MSDDEGEGRRRSRRSTKKVVSYTKEQEFSDGDVFEDSDKEEPTPKRGRPRKSSGTRKSTGSRKRKNDPDDDDIMDDDDDGFRSNKPIYTEKGYDVNLPPIRERFPFLPEFELDGSPRIDLLVGRRPVDEKGGNSNDKDSDDENQDPEEDEDEDSGDDDSEDGGRKSRRGKSSKKKAPGSPKKEKSTSTFTEYEYLVKYKNRSYLHLEWKTGADLESMNKSAKTMYRRFVKKIAQGLDEDLENPEFDPSYVVVQKIVAEREQEFTLELGDKELLKWEKEREKELAEESSDEDDEEEKKGEKVEEKPKEATEQPEAQADGKTEEKKGKFLFEGTRGDRPHISCSNNSCRHSDEPEENDWKEDIDFSMLTIERLKEILAKEESYYPVIEGCDNPYRDGYVTEPPKKPRASYLFFQCTMRSYFAKRNSNASQGELMTILGDQWKTMSEAEQAPFLELAKEEAKQFDKERQLLEKAQKPNEMWQPIRRCLMVLDRVSADGFANIFLEPVYTNDFPDYEEYIDTPMDLGTVRTKLKTRKYQAPEQFARDVRKVRS